MRKLRIFMLMLLAVSGFAVLAANVTSVPALAEDQLLSRPAGGDIGISSPIGTSTNGALAWEGELQKILNSLRGKTAKAVALMGIVVAGWGLIWGGEIGEFARRMFMLTMVLSIIMLSSQFVGKLRPAFEGKGTGTSTLSHELDHANTPMR